jgi:hypothetical protein
LAVGLGVVNATNTTFNGQIESSAALIHNCTFIGASRLDGSGGGAIRAFKIATITDSVFINCSAPAREGGAIYSNSGVLSVTNSNFTHCLPGAIYGDGAMAITDTNFTNCGTNTAEHPSSSTPIGAVVARGDAVFSNCVFTANTCVNPTARCGGALYCGGDNCVLRGCKFVVPVNPVP